MMWRQRRTARLCPDTAQTWRLVGATDPSNAPSPVLTLLSSPVAADGAFLTDNGLNFLSRPRPGASDPISEHYYPLNTAAGVTSSMTHVHRANNQVGAASLPSCACFTQPADRDGICLAWGV